MMRAALRTLAAVGVLLAAGSAVAQDGVQPNDAPPASDQPAMPEAAPASDAAIPAESAPAPAPESAAAPAAVQVESLNPLDLFSTGRDAGLGADVWKGASAEIARAVIPSIAAKPLSPAGADLARRLLAQSSTAPVGAGSDLDLAVARARALLALGDAEDASLVLDRTPGVTDHAELSQLAAEAALISEQDDKACRVADNLTDGRDGLYWLRLRAFCQARAGKVDEAQLTLNLAAAQGKDPIIARLLSAYVAVAGDPGPAALRDGQDFAVSRALKLDLTAALPASAPAIRRRWALKAPPSPSIPDAPASPIQVLVVQAVQAINAGAPDQQVLEHLVDQGAREPAPRTRARLQAAAAILASLGGR